MYVYVRAHARVCARVCSRPPYLLRHLQGFYSTPPNARATELHAKALCGQVGFAAKARAARERRRQRAPWARHHWHQWELRPGRERTPRVPHRFEKARSCMCMRCACGVHAVCMQCIVYTCTTCREHTARTPHVHCTHTARTQHAHSTYTALHVHYTCTAPCICTAHACRCRPRRAVRAWSRSSTSPTARASATSIGCSPSMVQAPSWQRHSSPPWPPGAGSPGSWLRPARWGPDRSCRPRNGHHQAHQVRVRAHDPRRRASLLALARARLGDARAHLEYGHAGRHQRRRRAESARADRALLGLRRQPS